MSAATPMNTPARYVIYPSGPLRGTVVIPGDKSITHRAVLFGGMAHGTTPIFKPLLGQDCRATMAALTAVGVTVEEVSDQVTITSPGWRAWTAPGDVIDCGNSGTTARLLTGLLSGMPFRSVLTGDGSLRKRPMGRVTEPLRRMGARIEPMNGKDGGEKLPLEILGPSLGETLTGIDYASPVASAQVKTALILAGLTATGTTRVSEPTRSRDHTERMLPGFGVALERDGNTVSVTGGQDLTGTPVTVPADLSSAAFLIAAATLVPGSELHLPGIGINPTRTGFLDVLAAMGGQVKITPRDTGVGEPMADLTIRHAPLTGTEIGPELVARTIDEFPILFALAACAQGDTTVRGAAELRVKESDRIAAMARELGRLGVATTEHADGLTVHGGNAISGGVCEADGDHRMAMSMAILGLVATAPVAVSAAPIATSFPGFAEGLAAVGAQVEITHAP